MLRHSDDGPSIGLIVCKGKKRLVAEYAIRDMSKPIGVVEHRLTGALPDELKGRLPTVDELASELRDSLDVAEDDVCDN